MTLFANRAPGETWRRCVLRHALPYGVELVENALDEYAALLEAGRDERSAAFHALLAWDLLQHIPRPVASSENVVVGGIRQDSPVAVFTMAEIGEDGSAFERGPLPEAIDRRMASFDTIMAFGDGEEDGIRTILLSRLLREAGRGPQED